MKYINIAAWVTTLILTLMILFFHNHSFPYHSDKDYIKDAYFDIYSQSKPKDMLIVNLKKELKKAASINDDYNIVEWMLNNDVCDENILNVLDLKIQGYEKNEYMILKRDPDHYYENESELNALNIKGLKTIVNKLHEKCN